jgi:hypothetical protein
VRSTINLGHDLGLTIIAEGVEDRETLEHLALLGCDLAQGYHLSRPMAAEAFTRWLDEPDQAPPATGAGHRSGSGSSTLLLLDAPGSIRGDRAEPPPKHGGVRTGPPARWAPVAPGTPARRSGRR